MKLIDLVQYADSNEKIPSDYLVPNTEKVRSVFISLFSAHLIDFLIISFLTTIISTLFKASIYSLLLTKGLKDFFLEQDLSILSIITIPLISFTYFFISYFMNQGQSYGMFIMKKRLSIKSSDFFKSLQWSIDSVFFCFSFGLTYFFNKIKWNALRPSDYLYRSLMEHKDFNSIDLLTSTKEYNYKKEQESYDSLAA